MALSQKDNYFIYVIKYYANSEQYAISIHTEGEARFSLGADSGKKGGAHSQTVSQFHLVIMQPNLYGILQLIKYCFMYEYMSRQHCLC